MKTVEELQAELDKANDANNSLSDKNKQILDEKKKLERKYKEVDLDEYMKLQDNFDKLEGEHNKLLKANGVLTKDFEKANGSLADTNKALNGLIVDDGGAKVLTSLEKHKLNEGALPLAMMAIKAKGVEVIDNVAMVGDKTLEDYIRTDFLLDPMSKNLVTPNANTGGGAGGGNSNSGGGDSRYFDKSSKDFSLTKQAEILKTNPALFAQLSN